MFARLREAVAHAFSTAPQPLEAEDERLLEDIAARVRAKRLTVPAMLGLDLVKHTPGIHVLFFGALPLGEHLAPFVTLGLVKTPDEARRLVRLSERREHVEALIRKIEAAAA